jgi:hypothetical protein
MASAAMPAASTDRGYYAPWGHFVTSPKIIFDIGETFLLPGRIRSACPPSRRTLPMTDNGMMRFA